MIICNHVHRDMCTLAHTHCTRMQTHMWVHTYARTRTRRHTCACTHTTHTQKAFSYHARATMLAQSSLPSEPALKHLCATQVLRVSTGNSSGAGFVINKRLHHVLQVKVWALESHLDLNPLCETWTGGICFPTTSYLLM